MAKKNYDELSKSILELVGGTSNINSVAHCITRLRFKLKDESKANTEEISKLNRVIQVISANGQYMVVIGNAMQDVYDSFLKVSGLNSLNTNTSNEDSSSKNSSLASRFIDIINSILSPILGPLAAAVS